MSKSNATETDLLAKIFNATALPWDGVTNLDVHLHTGDPGETGNSSTSEATYGGYALVQVARTSGGWTVSGNIASNTAAITFPACASGSNTLTHFSVTPRASTQILYSGALTASLAISAGITPSFAIGVLTCSED